MQHGRSSLTRSFLLTPASHRPCPSLGYTIVIAILALIGTTMLILYTSYVTFEEQIILSRTASNSLHKPNEKETSAADILKVGAELLLCAHSS